MKLCLRKFAYKFDDKKILFFSQAVLFGFLTEVVQFIVINDNNRILINLKLNLYIF